MKIEILKLLTFTLLLIMATTSCSNKETMEDLCKDKKILKVFEDEPATVTVAGGGYYYLNLINFIDYRSEFSGTLAPTEELPEQYREHGLAVYISGNVTNCFGSLPVEPISCIGFLNLFELTSIKIRNLETV